jgi:sugar/nucleoside kinase (ribokinase family)
MVPAMRTTGTPQAEQPRRVAVFGHANMEIVIPAGPFPISYEPDRVLTGGQISVGVSGTAYNEAIALWQLGSHVELCVSHAADDPVAAFLTASQPDHPRLRITRVPIPRQPLTAVLLGDHGERLILNDYRGNAPWQHDPVQAARITRDCDLAVIPFGTANGRLAEHAADLGVPVACDVHAIGGLTGPHEPFCQVADLLFMSDERLSGSAEEWLRQIMTRWPCRIAVIGQGARGAIMAVRGDPRPIHVPAVTTGPVVSTLGAGDALCAAFIDGHTRGLDPRTALQRATVYASAKVAHSGGAQGLLTDGQLDQLQTAISPRRNAVT